MLSLPAAIIAIVIPIAPRFLGLSGAYIQMLLVEAGWCRGAWTVAAVLRVADSRANQGRTRWRAC